MFASFVYSALSVLFTASPPCFSKSKNEEALKAVKRHEHSTKYTSFRRTRTVEEV